MRKSLLPSPLADRALSFYKLPIPIPQRGICMAQALLTTIHHPIFILQINKQDITLSELITMHFNFNETA